MRALLLPLLVLPAALSAQRYGELDVRRYGLVHDVPATRGVTVRRGIPYHVSGRDTLAIDVYRPPALAARSTRPVVLFVNAIGDSPGDRVRDWAIYRDWPRMVAAHGMIGVSMDAHRDSIGESIHRVVSLLAGPRARALGIDSSRIGLYAASANVSGTLAYLRSGRAPAAIGAVALYYGGVPSQPLPRIPTMVVVAQGDVPRMRPHLDTLWKAVIDSAAPWTLVFGRDLPHAFDGVTVSDEARRTIMSTIAFWQSRLTPLAQVAAPTHARRVVEASYAGDNARLATLLGEWSASHPSDTMALQMLGRALTGLGRSADAENAFRRALALDSNSVAAHVGLGQLAFNARRYPEAIAMLEGAVRRGWETSLIRGQLGFAYLTQSRHAEGAREYERAFQLGIPPGRGTTGIAAYNLASAYARLGRHEEAIAMLTRAIDNGFGDRPTIEGDEDFASLRSNDRFRALLARAAPGR